MNMLSPLRIPPSSKTNHTRKQMTPITNLDDVKVTSNDPKRTSKDLNTTSNNEPNENKKETSSEVVHILNLMENI